MVSRMRTTVFALALTLSGIALPARAQTPASGTAGQATETPEPPTWGAMEPGQGFEVVKTDRGNLWISGYMLARYLNQLPADQTFVDHLGRERVIDTRNDIQWHRVQVFLKGFVYSRRLRYTVNFWT